MRTINLLEADAAATRGSVAVVGGVASSDLARPTPCAGWDLRALLSHMTVQHRGFAAAAAGRGGDPAVWQPVADLAPADLAPADLAPADLTAANPAPANLTAANLTAANLTAANLTAANLTAADIAGAYFTAAEQVLAAFAEPGVLDRAFVLPEIPRQPSFPGRVAVGFHLVDYVVHGWDVAQTIGAAYDPASEVVAAALPVARAVPDGPGRLVPGAAFAPGLRVPPGASPLDEILLLLGRHPS